MNEEQICQLAEIRKVAVDLFSLSNILESSADGCVRKIGSMVDAKAMSIVQRVNRINEYKEIK